MADAIPLAAPARPTLRSILRGSIVSCCLAGGAIAAAALAQERAQTFSVERESAPARGAVADAQRPQIALRWRSDDGRFGVALIDNGVSLRADLTGYDATGRARCNSTGPLLVYDNADWMDLRWRTLIEEQGNFLRTCHVIDQRAARRYRGQFLRDAARFPAALASFKSEARALFGPSRARCLDFRDGSDIAAAGRDRCEQMIER